MAYSTIRKGSSNEDVKTWQDFLKGQGYNIATDGIFGDETDSATKDWQTNNGLTVDGIVGTNTWASMNIGNNTNTNNSSATDNNAKSIPDILGADKSLVEKGLSSFEGSDELKGLENEKNEYKDKAQEFLSNTDIVDENTKKEMNSQLSDYLSPEIDKANAWLSSQLEKIQSGKTSYTDQMNGLMDKIMNRDPFEYDVDNDQLFQQALASAMNSGKTAMQDTIGQASSLTGGYGSTYATNVGNQAYNQFIEDAYNNLPEYYQMALEAYQMEGQDLYNQFNMLSTADANEWSKMVQGYDATMQYSNTLYDRGFNEWSTTVNNAINKGNFQLNEHSTIANNLMGAYDISANEYETKYSEEWNNWNREIENAWNVIGMQNSDAWNQKNFDESVRQFDLNYDQTERWNQADLDYKYANLNFEKEQFNYSKGDTNNDGVVDDEEKKKKNKAELKSPTADMNKKALEAYNTGGTAAMNKYINSIPDDYDKESIAVYVGEYGEEYGEYYDYSISNDTDNGGFLWWKGEDHNDEYSLKDKDGNFDSKTTLTYDELKEKIKNSNMPKEQKDALLKSLKGQSKK